MNTNLEALKVERSINRIIDRMHKAKSEGRYDRLIEYRTIFNNLITKWEAVKGQSIENNPVMYNRLVDKLKELK